MQKNRLNHQIKASEVRVVRGPETGVMSFSKALALATDNGLDLIEISLADMPVCIIEELGKWKFEQAKKAKAQKQTVVETKTVQIRPVTEEHDLEVKAKAVREFLADGHRVRLVVKFRGRELAHPDEGREALEGLVARCADAGQLDGAITGLEGKQMACTMVPRKK